MTGTLRALLALLILTAAGVLPSCTKTAEEIPVVAAGDAATAAVSPDADIEATNLTAGGYVNLSVRYINEGKYSEAIDACDAALAIRRTDGPEGPDDARVKSLAYNNLCVAYTQMAEWDKAIDAGRRALAIDPGFDRARNNLQAAEREKARNTGAAKARALEETPTISGYIDLSLTYCNEGTFDKAVEACRVAIQMCEDGDDDAAKKQLASLAYNNMCFSYAKMGQWDAAIDAGQKAVEMNPDFARAPNNLAWAEREKARVDTENPTGGG